MGGANYDRHEVDVLLATDAGDEAMPDEAALAILQHDPAWAWLHDPEEDVYTEAGTRPAFGD